MAECTAPRVGNLPAEVTSFVGRCSELAEIKRLCADSPMVTVTGVGGVGKTRTALRAAAELSGDFRDGVWVVELSALRDGDLLGHAIARTLRVVDQTTRPQVDVLADHLADKHLLLVLDTCEHLLDTGALLAEILLRAAPELHILATSRQPLGVPGEKTLAIHPLPVTQPDRAPTGEAAQPEAMVLFDERASAVAPGYAPTAQNRESVARLCRKLDGIPLAIELAAGQLPRMSIEQLLTQLDDRFHLLVSDSRTPVSRHQTLRTTVGWSHQLCTRQERLLWTRASVFADDFDIQAAVQVCGDGQLPADRIPHLVAELVGKSILLRHATEDGAVRYRLLDTLRSFGAEWLQQLGEQDTMRLRHRDWYLRFAEQAEEQWLGHSQADVAERIHREYANICAALEFSLTTPEQAQTGMRMAASLHFYWLGCGFLSEGRHWLDRALALDPEPTRAQAKALWVNGYIAIKQGDSERAVSLLEASQAQALRAGDETALANAIHRLGCVALCDDDHARAAGLFKEALAHYEALGELNTSVIMARVELAMATAFQGDLATAVGMCEEIRAICEQHGERWVKAYALYVLAFAAWAKGDVCQATAIARESLEISHTFHDLVASVLAIELLALFQAASDRSRDAAALQGAARQIWRTVGLPLFGSAYFNAPHHDCEARARQALGDRDYEKAYEQGSRLRLDEAVAFALGEAPAPASVAELFPSPSVTPGSHLVP